MSLALEVTPPRTPHFFERTDWQPLPYGCMEFNRMDRLPVRRGDEIVIRYLEPFEPPPPPGNYDTYLVQAVLEGGALTFNVGQYTVHSSGVSVFYVDFWPSMPPGCYRLDVRAGINPPIFQLTGVQVIGNDTCNTSVIEFRGCTNQLGYEYAHVFPGGVPQYQRVRIWGRLEKERLEADSDVFFGSNGLVQKVYARTRRIFDLNTRWMGHYQSMALALAVQHDEFYIRDGVYGTLALTAVDQAEFSWPNTPLDYPGSSKVTVKMTETGWNKINTYCVTC